jgi:hypothetical protein
LEAITSIIALMVVPVLAAISLSQSQYYGSSLKEVGRPKM